MIELGAKVTTPVGRTATVVARQDWLFGEPRYGVSADEFDGYQIQIFWFKESELSAVGAEPKKKAQKTWTPGTWTPDENKFRENPAQCGKGKLVISSQDFKPSGTEG